MSIEARLIAALDQGWDFCGSQAPFDTELPETVSRAVDDILSVDSPPNRIMLVTIAAGTAAEPASNPRAIQMAAGVDRRGQARVPIRVLSKFVEDRGLTLKISKDPGVSNQWREPRIDEDWVGGRRGQALVWASAFHAIVTWLEESATEEARGERAQQLLEFVCFSLVQLAASNVLNYPRFQATPKLAMTLVSEFLRSAPNVPDALEAVVTVAARVLASVLNTSAEVVRGDTNSPDAIDVLLVSSDGRVRSGIEVTDEPITLAKLQHEVLPAMLKHGLDRATVVSRGIDPADAAAIEAWVQASFARFGQRIDLAVPTDIETWLSFPAAPAELATNFLWAVGGELDLLSGDGNRRAWFNTLNDYINSASEASARMQDATE
jgi:hypothetical protein